MKVETTIVIEADLLKEIDEFADKDNNRSEFVEKALREYLSKLMRERRDKRDAEIINRNADALNEEAMDVLSYQIDL
jgi:metal-responsive CopG/Arc/MetJ family transcriptional regulator